MVNLVIFDVLVIFSQHLMDYHIVNPVVSRIELLESLNRGCFVVLINKICMFLTCNDTCSS